VTDSEHGLPRFIYISNRTWAAIKQQATLEGQSVSSLVEYILSVFFEEPYEIPLPERRSLSEEEALMYHTRAVYIGVSLWNRLKDWSKQKNKASKSGLLEVLIKKYLGLDEPIEKQRSDGPHIKIPENGFVIDLDKLKKQ
jgi:hypothetical protein